MPAVVNLCELFTKIFDYICFMKKNTTKLLAVVIALVLIMLSIWVAPSIEAENNDPNLGVAYARLQSPYDEVHFVHKANTANIGGGGLGNHITTIDHPALNGQREAKIFITANYNPNGVGGVYNDHPIGAYYYDGRWRVFNQDFAPIPIGAAFNIFIPNSAFVHIATAANIDSHMTYVGAELPTDSSRQVFVTQNWSVFGVSNPAHIGVYYNGSQWAIFNQNHSMPMPNQASFNVASYLPTALGIIQHTALAANTDAHITRLDHPQLNGNPNALIQLTQHWTAVYNDKEIGVYYDGTRWAIFNQDLSAMPLNAKFNVLISNTSTDATATPTNTPVPAATNTPLVATTATNTPVAVATATNTPLVATTTTNTPVAAATATNTPVAAATVTNTPVPLVTATPAQSGVAVIPFMVNARVYIPLMMCNASLGSGQCVLR